MIQRLLQSNDFNHRDESYQPSNNLDYINEGKKLETNFSLSPDILTTDRTISPFFTIIPIESFYDFDFSGDEAIPSENVRISFSDNNANKISNQLKRLVNVKNLVLYVHTKLIINIFKELKMFARQSKTLSNLYLEIEMNSQDQFHKSIFYDIFSKFSSLQYISIRSHTVSEKDFGIIFNSIKRNNRMRNLARSVSEKIRFFRSSKIKKINKIIQLAKFYREFWILRQGNYINIETFCGLLDSDITEKEKEQFKDAEQYHLFYAIKDKEFEFVKKSIIPHYTSEEKNAIYDANSLMPMRVIDNVTNPKILIELFNNFGFSPFTHEQADHNRPPTQTWALKNTLFTQENHKTIWNINLLRCINSHEDIFLDALALLVDKNKLEEVTFAKLLNEYYGIIKPNRTIESGIYKGYTLIQILCLNWHKLRSDFLADKNTLNSNGYEDIKYSFFGYLDSIALEERMSILNSQFPERDKENCPLTVMQYLIYHHYTDLLFKIYPQYLVLTNIPGYLLTVEADKDNQWAGLNFLTLFLKGLIDHQVEYDKLKYPPNLSSLYDWLMNETHKPLWSNGTEFSTLIIPFIEGNTKIRFPVLHYLIRYANSRFIDEFIALKLFDIFFSIDVKVTEYEQYLDLAILDILILYGNINIFDKTYQKIATWLNAHENNKLKFYQLLSKPISGRGEYAHHTPFQIAILRNFHQLITVTGKHLNLKQIANQAFPDQIVLYRGWRPIQVAVYLFKRLQVDEALFLTLINCDVDLSVCYPHGSCYLEGLNILQAVIRDKTADSYSSILDNKSSLIRNCESISSAVEKASNVNDAINALFTTSMAFAENYGKLSNEAVKHLLNKLSDEDINFTCQYKLSACYGTTALHIAVYQNDYEYVELLLSSPKTNYTKRDSKDRSALDIAKYINKDNLISLLRAFEVKFPNHIDDYRKGLKYDSEVNPNFQVTHEEWVVSIVRERHSEHAFLIMEGIELDQDQRRIRPVTKIAHLVAPSFYGKGKVKTAQEPLEGSNEWFEYGQQKNTNALHKLASRTPAIQLRPGMQFFPESDNVSRAKCQAIWNEIKAEEKENNTYYSAWGRRGLLGVSSSSNRMNCVDWARSKYNSLVKPGSQLKADWSMYFVTLARGFLNYRFNYVKREQKNYLEDQVFRTTTLVKGVFNRQNTLINRQNMLHGIFAALLAYILTRESYAENNYIDNFYLSLFIAIATGRIVYKITETFFSPHESLVDEEASNQNFSLSN